MPARPPVHPLPVRLAHTVNALALGCMMASGWAVYNASPLFGWRIPSWATLGGWLGGSLAWHFAAMWLLLVNGLLYTAYGLGSGHFARRLMPIRPRELAGDLRLALTLRLAHTPGIYNAVQRLLYLVVLLLGVLIAASGLALWKPVQLAPLSDLFGGYEFTRRVHFAAMAGIAAFVVVHLALVAAVPRTLWPMVAGGSPDPARSR